MLRITVTIVAAALAAFSQVSASEATTKASQDLASRLKIGVKEISVISEKPTTWFDGSLGLRKPDRVYTKAIEEGSVIVLKAKNTKFLYTSSRASVVFGGPVDLWKNSLLYIAKHENEPNLNGDLKSCSPLGTNPLLVLESVSSYQILANKDILALRRTSRSGFELLLLKSGQTKPIAVDGGFAYGAFGSDGKNWAAFKRERIGNEWNIVYGQVGSKNPKFAPMLGEGEPSRFVWSGSRILAQTDKGWFSLDTSTTNPNWQKSDGPIDLNEGPILLNKSETLVVEADGKDAVVATEWFTGTKKEIARISNLKLKSFEYVLGRYVVVSGVRNDQLAVFVVDLSTKAVFESLAGDYREAHASEVPTLKPIEFKDAIK